jgi:LPS sulfotransferase NodH
MSITLDLSREEELLLQQAARAAGSRDVASYIRQQLFAALPAANASRDDLDFLRTEGRNAVRASQQDLIDKGISYVYAANTDLIRHHPDGTEEVIAPLNSAADPL